MATMENSVKECYIDLDVSAGLFDRLIVYLPRKLLQDGGVTSKKGEFKCFPLTKIISETKLDDWHLEANCYYNDYGTRVKPVEVTTNDREYHESYLFCRILTLASKNHVVDIERYLNAYLEQYKDELRDGIAQEWCSQEQFRIFPRRQDHCIEPLEVDSSGKATLYKVPNVNMKEVLRDMLPQGWDDERPI